MRTKILGSVLLVLASGALTGCDKTIYIIGSVTGLTTQGLVLQNNGGDDLSVGGNGTFRFATPAAPNSAYAVTIKSQPTWSTCEIGNGSGTTGPGNAVVNGENNDVTDVVVRCTPNGAAPYALNLFAGGLSQIGTADGSGADARFNSQLAIAADGAGNVYVADTGNSTIRKISADGVVTSLAGAPDAGHYGSADGIGAAAMFKHPQGVAVDAAGNVYVADTANHTVRKISPVGAVTTLAGVAGSAGNVDGSAADARFSEPYGVAVDGGGNVYVADTGNHTIRKISPAGVVSTLAGGTPETFGAHADGLGNMARFHAPLALAVDASGNVYVADTGNHTIRKITSSGWVTTLAGKASVCLGFEQFSANLTQYSCGNGNTDGTGADARFDTPSGIAVDSNGNVYVADKGNFAIRKITPERVVTSIVGSSRPADLAVSPTVQLGPLPAFLGVQTRGVATLGDKLYIGADQVVLWTQRL